MKYQSSVITCEQESRTPEDTVALVGWSDMAHIHALERKKSLCSPEPSFLVGVQDMPLKNRLLWYVDGLSYRHLERLSLNSLFLSKYRSCMNQIATDSSWSFTN